MKAVQSRSARMLSLLKTSPLPEPPFLDSVVIDVFPVGSAFFFGVDRGNPGRVPDRFGTCSGSDRGGVTGPVRVARCRAEAARFWGQVPERFGAGSGAGSVPATLEAHFKAWRTHLELFQLCPIPEALIELSKPPTKPQCIFKSR